MGSNIAAVHMAKHDGVWAVVVRYVGGDATADEYATFGDALQAALDAGNKSKEE